MKYIKFSQCTVLYFLVCGDAFGINPKTSIKSIPPIEACNFLTKEGLVTNGYRALGAQLPEYFCVAMPLDIPGDGVYGLKNRVGLQIVGTSDAVSYFELILYINNREDAASAHQRLVELARALFIKATKQELPKDIQEAISSGNVLSKRMGNVTVEVIRDEYPDGKAYEIKFFIKEAKG